MLQSSVFFTPEKKRNLNSYSSDTSSTGSIYTPPPDSCVSSNKKQRIGKEMGAPLYAFDPSDNDKEKIEQRKLAARYSQKEENAKKCFFKIDQIAQKLNDFSRDKYDIRNYKELFDRTIVKLFRFVLTQKLELILGPNEDYEYYSHGNMADGGCVFAAGEFGFDQTGKLRYVSNTTGHYRVPQDCLLYVLYPYLMDEYGYSLEDIQSLHQGTWTRSPEDAAHESQYSCDLVGETFHYDQRLPIVLVNDNKIVENSASVYSTPPKSTTSTSNFSYVTP